MFSSSPPSPSDYTDFRRGEGAGVKEEAIRTRQGLAGLGDGEVGGGGPVTVGRARRAKQSRRQRLRGYLHREVREGWRVALGVGRGQGGDGHQPKDYHRPAVRGGSQSHIKEMSQLVLNWGGVTGSSEDRYDVGPCVAQNRGRHCKGREQGF